MLARSPVAFHLRSGSRLDPVCLPFLLLWLAGTSCVPYAKPWKSPEERTRYMVTVAARMLAPVPDACITEALDRLKRPNQKKSSYRGGPGGLCSPEPVVGESRGEAPAASCAEVFRTCGNCHLPKVNNCNYRFTFKHEAELVETVSQVRGVSSEAIVLGRRVERIVLKDGKGVFGRVLSQTRSDLIVFTADGLRKIPLTSIAYQQFGPSGDGPSKSPFPSLPEIILPVKSLTKIEWRDGADPLEAWWDFKRFTPRGRTAERMFDLVARHQVG